MTHAIRFHKTGGPEVLVWEEVKLGKPGPGEARIRHTAIGLNFVDIYNRAGVYPVQLPSGLGGEAAGVVEDSGRYAAMYKPYHLIGLELNISILSAALRGEPTGQPHGFRGDAVAVAKRALRTGEMLDGEGGYTVSGKLMPAAASLSAGALPIGLAHRLKLKNPVARGAVVRWSDVEIDANDETVKTRRAMETKFGGNG